MGKGGIIKRSLPFVIIVAVCIIAFRQVAFLQETLKFDILDGYLPGHYFVSECLRNNLFPLWNPYQQLGFPLYADMLNTNYIVDMFIGRLFPYTNVTFHVCFILYVIIAGIGAFRLAIKNGITMHLSLLTGIAYSLSGFITGNAQHIQFIIGAAWLPFCILYFISFIRKPELLNALLFIVFTYLLITGGYPSFAIFLAYGMLPVYLFFLIRNIKRKQSRTAISYLLYGVLIAVILVVLCSGIIISIRQATPYVERYVKLTYEYAVTNPFPPSALISLVSPFVTAVHSDIFPTDISMNNHYFGVIVLILFIYSLTMNINRKGIILLIAAGIILLFSFGEHAFLHRIFFEHVPLFNKFRHPSSFRFITILILLLFTGIQLIKFDPVHSYHKRFRMIYFICISAIAVICVLSALIILYKIAGPLSFVAKWDNFLHDYGVYGPLFIQTLILLAINIPFIYAVFIRKRISLFYPLIIAILIIEMVVFTGLNMRYTVTSHYDPLDIRAFLRNSPAGFPLPDQLPVSANTDESIAHIPLINNTNTYSKSVSADIMYPFILDSYRRLKNDSNLFSQLIDHKVFYFEDHQLGDTIICTEFNPQKLAFTVLAVGSRKAVLLQNFYPGRTARIDGQKVDLKLVHGALTGLEIPAGNHQVEFEFRNPVYVKATLGAFGLFILLILIILLINYRKEKTSYFPIFYIILIVILVFLVSIPRKSYSEKKAAVNAKLSGFVRDFHDQDALMVFNIETIEPFLPYLGNKKFINNRFRNSKDLQGLLAFIDTTEVNKVVYFRENVTEPVGMISLLSLRFPAKQTIYSADRARILEFTRQSRDSSIKADYSNDYEKVSDNFSNEGIIYDSTTSFSGRFSEILTGERLYSSTLQTTLSGNAVDIFTMVRFRLKDDKSAHLVLSVDRRGKNLYYDAVDLREFESSKEGWNTAFIARNFLKSTLKKGDKLTVYCWNSGNNSAIHLDDFIVNCNSGSDLSK